MKYKQVLLSVILNAFLGYLWLLFILYVIESLDSAIIKAIIIILGTTLFGEIVGRIAPFHQYKFTHPLKLVSFSSCLVVVIIGVFMFDIV
ncbi:hypothetical protein PALU110988_30225 [Paenibacillus lupini]|uniref:hypothetical protein n=1 Tax=Paenibacillus lupini TaxID=1450204 RepID=UPI0014209600|nr:hypothetical protein [Paenibacillus lupini]NIK25247.1 type IV secretory pathway TrbL component [Paenibacillus lupini]